MMGTIKAQSTDLYIYTDESSVVIKVPKKVMVQLTGLRGKPWLRYAENKHT